MCRQIASLKLKALVLFEISELALYTIERELSVANIDVYPILGSVNDTGLFFLSFCFVCLRPVSFVPNIASVSGKFILDCPFDLP
jgi:hypothetical protein